MHRCSNTLGVYMPWGSITNGHRLITIEWRLPYTLPATTRLACVIYVVCNQGHSPLKRVWDHLLPIILPYLSRISTIYDPTTMGGSINDKACIEPLRFLTMGFSKKWGVQNPEGKQSPHDTLLIIPPTGVTTGNMESIINMSLMPRVGIQRSVYMRQ